MHLLETRHLSKRYDSQRGWHSSVSREVKAVDDVSLCVLQGEALALVGQSGSGKSTLGRLLLGLEKPTSGRLLYKGTDITGWGIKSMRGIRSGVQMVFQNNVASFNPLFTVEDIVGEPLYNYKLGNAKERRLQVLNCLSMVELDAAYLKRYPHELSGGQQQRVGIARALALRPELIICDEPFSSLDFTLRYQLLNLLHDLRMKLSLSYVFITHDLSAAAFLCDRVAVMHNGQIVEMLPADRMVEEARHPYSSKLLAAIPVQDPRLRIKKHTFSEDRRK